MITIHYSGKYAKIQPSGHWHWVDEHEADQFETTESAIQAIIHSIRRTCNGHNVTKFFPLLSVLKIDGLLCSRLVAVQIQGVLSTNLMPLFKRCYRPIFEIMCEAMDDDMVVAELEVSGNVNAMKYVNELLLETGGKFLSVNSSDHFLVAFQSDDYLLQFKLLYNSQYKLNEIKSEKIKQALMWDNYVKSKS